MKKQFDILVYKKHFNYLIGFNKEVDMFMNYLQTEKNKELAADLKSKSDLLENTYSDISKKSHPNASKTNNMQNDLGSASFPDIESFDLPGKETKVITKNKAYVKSKRNPKFSLGIFPFKKNKNAFRPSKTVVREVNGR